MWQITSISNLLDGGDHFPIFLHLPSPGYQWSWPFFHACDQGKGERLFFYCVSWQFMGKCWNKAVTHPHSPLALHHFFVQLGNHFKGGMLWLTLSFCTKLAKDVGCKYIYIIYIYILYPHLNSSMMRNLFPNSTENAQHTVRQRDS